jgi:hypothetical protein
MQLDKMPLNFKRYLILRNIRKKSHLEINTIKVDNSTRHESPGRRYKRGDTIEMDAYLEDNKNMISDYLRLILTSEELGQERITKIETLLKSRSIRSYFSKCLYQDKFENEQLQVLSNKGFEDMAYMIFHALLMSNNNPNQYDDIRLMTISSFSYYK